MRFARFGLLIFLLSGISVWAQQPTSSQQATSGQSPSDPQAVAVVRAAITALGGATAISQAQSWKFQAQMRGPHANDAVSYSMSTDVDTGKVVAADGSMRADRPTHSHFLPALVAAVLLRESQDPNFTFFYEGAATGNSQATTVIRVMFSSGSTRFPAQFWCFDSTNLPTQIDFRLPAEIGARQSFRGIDVLSDYRSVSGVLYPFRIT